ncbi:DUF3944 domain-containing protein [Aliarcobacter cryaerophilus]|uniref:DUF3944 domain-containing protein n=1 Tax=Aliarcobacter cryaerophilus TaxID=28198 RepID=UPI0021B52101|nr:DUF3944 domain-containing protein [Aliarcobacter cryaerophilus]MCT7471621.1 DUF3944 domain-containing protein [Aliarcobacter cryaerophilus]MCT7532736.1 DUF3944 domain-containing protein [Aliarcobacter cryaerophilus]
MKYIEDKDLNFLRNFNSKELDNLVNILTKPLTQELTNREMYKEFYPEHSLYIEEILSELQHFGGNTIANVIRKKGVVYAEILDDVCKALGFKIRNKLSIEEKEELLLKVGKDDGITKNIGRQITSLDTKDTLAFLTYIPAFITKKVSDPAYRITIEAVFEIASLRKQYNLNQENTISQDNKQKNLLLEYSEEIIVKDEESSSNLAEIKVIDNNSLDKINFEEENSIAVGGISHLLSDITKGTISVSNKTIELVFSPEVIEGIKNGNLYIAEGRAWVKNVTTERFAGHAHIVEVGQTAQFLTGGYQLLSIAVAQSHLADIEKRLYSIDNSLKQIIEKLELEDKSRIQGAISYIKSILENIKKNDYKKELSPAQKNQIEQKNSDILHWRDKLLLEFDILVNDVYKIGNIDTFGTENIFNELKKVIKDRINPLKDRYSLLIELNLLLTILIKYIDPEDKEFTKIDINLDEFSKKIELISKSIEDKQQSKLKSIFNKDYTLEDRKKVLDLLQNKYKDDFNNLSTDYKDKVLNIDNAFNISNNNMSIFLSLDENLQIKQYLLRNN